MSKWETQASVPDIGLLPGIAVFFGVTIDELFGKGKPEKTLEYWNAGVEHFPERWQSYCDRADGFQKPGRYEEALADYEKCF